MDHEIILFSRPARRPAPPFFLRSHSSLFAAGRIRCGSRLLLGSAESPVLETKGTDTDPGFFIVPAVPVPIQYLYRGTSTGGPCIAIIILCRN